MCEASFAEGEVVSKVQTDLNADTNLLFEIILEKIRQSMADF